MTNEKLDIHARERAWIELDMDALKYNVASLGVLMRPGCELMAVLKANAYGHGVDAVAPYLDKIGVRAYAVANIDEAVHLRALGVRGVVLIFGRTDPERASELHDHDLTQTVMSGEYAAALSLAGVPVKCHLEIDTGMHRSGVPWEDVDGAGRIFSLPGLDVTGVYTHLSSSDSLASADIRWSRTQISRFQSLLDTLRSRGVSVPKTHIQSTYGLLNYPELDCDYVRVGIALYGVLSYVNRMTRIIPDLRPVLSLKARVSSVQPVKAGEGVGYGRAFVARRDGLIATLSVGYRDGVPRPLSGTGHVSINGRLAPIVGKICMDNMTVDATDVPDLSPGDIATVIGGSLPASLVASQSGAFTPELLGRLSPTLPILCL